MKKFISNDGRITLIHADCMDYMAQLSDGEFDLAVVDPPYRDQNQPTKDMRNNGSMKTLEGRPTRKYWELLKQKSKEQIIWGANNFQLPQFKGFIVWEKTTISENFTMSMAEIASISEGLGTVSKIYKQQPQDLHRIHPTQKPIKLYQWIYNHYAKPTDRVLDTHLGSGSSAIAAHYEGLEFVGIELDEDYYNAAVARFKEETSQTVLF